MEWMLLDQVPAWAVTSDVTLPVPTEQVIQSENSSQSSTGHVTEDQESNNGTLSQNVSNQVCEQESAAVVTADGGNFEILRKILGNFDKSEGMICSNGNLDSTLDTGALCEKSENSFSISQDNDNLINCSYEHKTNLDTVAELTKGDPLSPVKPLCLPTVGSSPSGPSSLVRRLDAYKDMSIMAKGSTCSFVTMGTNCIETSAMATENNTLEEETSAMATENNTLEEETSVMATKTNHTETSAMATGTNCMETSTMAIENNTPTADTHTLAIETLDPEISGMMKGTDNAVNSSIATEPSPTENSAMATSTMTKGINGDIKLGLNSEDNGRPRRKSRRLTAQDDVHAVPCPVCGQILKTPHIASHVQTELYKLEKLSKTRRSYDGPTASCSKKVPICERLKTGDDEDVIIMDSPARYKAYLKTRTRRERRLKAARKPVKTPGDEETRCPVCNEMIVGTADELTEHVDQCLQQQEADSSAELDVEGEEGYEEYTWAGQTRIRASTMIPGGLAASGFQSCKSREEDEDVDLDIDGDDCNVFGKSQYTEADVIPCSVEEPEEDRERRALRRAVLRVDGRSSSLRSVPDDRQRWQTSTDTAAGDKRIQKDCQDDSGEEGVTEVVESLKARIRDQAIQLEKLERPKCLICMDWYTKPLASIQCWHVHCEECWLRTLGTKKLCPQCNTITSPTDLRRIYL